MMCNESSLRQVRHGNKAARWLSWAQGMRKLAHLYWCVWNMDVNGSSFVEANDLQICVDVETDILTSQINMLDKLEKSLTTY